MIYTQRQKTRDDRREARNPHAHAAASFRQGSALGLDRNATEGLLDCRAHLRRRQAARDEQAALGPILLGRHR
jgi:hypothetical protein